MARYFNVEKMWAATLKLAVVLGKSGPAIAIQMYLSKLSVPIVDLLRIHEIWYDAPDMVNSLHLLTFQMIGDSAVPVMPAIQLGQRAVALMTKMQSIVSLMWMERLIGTNLDKKSMLSTPVDRERIILATATRTFRGNLTVPTALSPMGILLSA
jgi:hypothetical protein